MYSYKITYFILETILLVPIVIYNLVAIQEVLLMEMVQVHLSLPHPSLVLWRILVNGLGYQPPVASSSPMQSAPLIKKPFSELRYLLMDLLHFYEHWMIKYRLLLSMKMSYRLSLLNCAYDPCSQSFLYLSIDVRYPRPKGMLGTR